jgi:hypothetical protein
MRFDKRLPGSLPGSFRSWFYSVLFEDVANGLVGNVVAEVGQRSLDSIVSRGVKKLERDITTFKKRS